MRWPLVMLLCVVAGCEAARVPQPLTRSITGDDADAQLEFWHQLEQQPITCNDDAFHGLLLFADGKDDAQYWAAASLERAWRCCTVRAR